MSEAALSAAASAPDKEAAYTALIEQFASAQDVTGLNAVVEHVLGAGVSATIKPKLLAKFTGALPRLAPQAHEAVAEACLAKINSSSTRASHDPQVRQIYEGLGALYQAHGEWEKAAKALCKVPFNGVQINMTQEEKLGSFVTIASLFLKYRNALEAGAYINKALHELSQIQAKLERGVHPPENVRRMKAQLELAVAQRDDLSGEYGKAAKSYEKLSRNVLAFELGGGQATLLKQAVLCALLMPAGKASKQLDVLTMDDRLNPEKTPELAEIYPLMTKMHQLRLMRAADIELLISHVHDYQQPSVRRSIKEHNLLAASKAYANISIEELARLLQVEALEAETIAAGMIKEKRLHGLIDQQSVRRASSKQTNHA